MVQCLFFNHSLPDDLAVMASHKCTVIGKHVVVIQITTATIQPVRNAGPLILV